MKKYLPKNGYFNPKNDVVWADVDLMLLHVVDCIPRKNIQYQSWLR